MYPGKYAQINPDRPAIIMAGSGESITYAEYESRCNQLAHLFRSLGLQRGDHFAIFMENNVRYLETCGAGERSGLYYTPISAYLTADELAYIINNSDSKLLITSSAKADVARKALTKCPNILMALVVDADGDDQIRSYQSAVAEMPTTPIEDESMGSVMIYSSGTTGRPKGILRPLADCSPDTQLPAVRFSIDMWKYREDMVCLSPAPLYHSAPQGAVGQTLRMGGTAIIMEKFDAQACLETIENYQVTHCLMVPTMFTRILKLPEKIRARANTSSLEMVFHLAAPCPVQIKEQMIEWWGPIILETYGFTEGIGFASCNSEEWLAHKGTVGKITAGVLHILDDNENPVPTGTPCQLWFENNPRFEYFKDPKRTMEACSADGKLATVGDVGYLDEDGYLYLTDRATFMIISGGVNIYPQETENLLITHPKVYDAAVIGVPNEEYGEEVKAVVQAMPEANGDEELEAELIAFCEENLSKLKCPKSIDFVDELPRQPTGKLYKTQLRDRYWGEKKIRIL